MQALLDKAGKNASLQRDPHGVYLASAQPVMVYMLGILPFAYNQGREITQADVHEGLIKNRDEWAPLVRTSEEARRTANDACVRADM